MQKSRIAKNIGAVEREREREALYSIWNLSAQLCTHDLYKTNSTANENYNLKGVKRIKTVNNDKTKTYEKQIGY